ncbi:CLUMA_CG002280, isoform A [Clunio marinus]|uniref:CLUMA_CG002280, isoform A n=1 Tax=Clunio marinus TaxID=568069 RepID=A0A1J1HM04_9DIPT|nr:CLUMA_CG002280, isoform A [Clunio marinus]
MKQKEPRKILFVARLKNGKKKVRLDTSKLFQCNTFSIPITANIQRTHKLNVIALFSAKLTELIKTITGLKTLKP